MAPMNSKLKPSHKSTPKGVSGVVDILVIPSALKMRPVVIEVVILDCLRIIIYPDDVHVDCLEVVPGMQSFEHDLPELVVPPVADHRPIVHIVILPCSLLCFCAQRWMVQMVHKRTYIRFIPCSSNLPVLCLLFYQKFKKKQCHGRFLFLALPTRLSS